jgi:hypothetical protein
LIFKMFYHILKRNFYTYAINVYQQYRLTSLWLTCILCYRSLEILIGWIYDIYFICFVYNGLLYPKVKHISFQYITSFVIYGTALPLCWILMNCVTIWFHCFPINVKFSWEYLVYNLVFFSTSNKFFLY